MKYAFYKIVVKFKNVKIFLSWETIVGVVDIIQQNSMFLPINIDLFLTGNIVLTYLIQ